MFNIDADPDNMDWLQKMRKGIKEVPPEPEKSPASGSGNGDISQSKEEK